MKGARAFLLYACLKYSLIHADEPIIVSTQKGKVPEASIGVTDDTTYMKVPWLKWQARRC
jgi:hypothetical protein